MNKLYSVSDAEFEEWLASKPSEDDLREAYMLLEVKKSLLWIPGADESYYRDRFERDDSYMKRLRRIKEELAGLWSYTGQINPLR